MISLSTKYTDDDDEEASVRKEDDCQEKTLNKLSKKEMNGRVLSTRLRAGDDDEDASAQLLRASSH